MVSILQANAVQVFEENDDNVPSNEEKALSSGAPMYSRRMRVDENGYLTTKSLVRSKRRQ